MADDSIVKETTGGSYDQVENVRTGRKRGFAGHCKKWWWVYLIAVLAIVLVVVLIVIFVAVPKIAQSKIDASELTVQSIVVSNTQTDNFTMSISSTITTDGSVHANIDDFDGVMYLEDLEPHTPFTSVHFPKSTADAYQVVNVTDQFTPITNMAAFTTFNTWLLLNETLRVTIKGDTYVHVAGLSSRAYKVTFQKTVTIPGLINFNGTTVANPSINVTGFEDGTNFHATTTIPNRSVVTFDIGNATFHNYLLGEEIGTVYIDNIVLRPGLNTFPMRANISQLPVLSALSKDPYCKNGVLPFQLLGKTVFNNGQPLPYYADSLAVANQSVPIDLSAPMTALGLPPKCSS